MLNPRNVTRTKCLIGKNVDATLSSVKIYRKALSLSKILSEKVSTYPTMVHYWPLKSNLDDVISNASLSSYGLVSFSNATYVKLSSGYLCLPVNFYFNKEFTFSVWINFSQIKAWATILDCNGIVLVINGDLKVEIQVWQDANTKHTSIVAVGNNLIEENLWNHFDVTLKSDELSLYLNGNIILAQDSSLSFDLLKKYFYHFSK